MKLFNKTSLALALSLVGVATTISALAMTTAPEKQLHEITVAAGDNRDAQIMISIDGKITKLTVSKEALKDKELLAQNNGNLAATMSGTNSGITSGDVTYAEAGYKRGNPNNNDYYGFLNISLYKTFVGNSNWFKSMNSKQKRKIRHSF